MPLARFHLRNESVLGKPDLYSEASPEDPKAVLDGVTVAGLVGILRQLGNLAEFAGEVFHGLQEEATRTASRSRNLMVRVQGIEAALPPLEKKVLAQTSHLHFAYTAGYSWHARLRCQQHHFIDDDLPQLIMNSYEECRDPPHLHLLDKFDNGGAGSCMRRYSDPTIFRRVSMRSDEPNVVEVQINRKGHKRKKKRSFPKNGEYSRGTSMSTSSGRMNFYSAAVDERTSPPVSVDDSRYRSSMEDQINSFDTGPGYIECIFSQNENVQLEEVGSHRSSSLKMMRDEDSVSQEEVTFAVDKSSVHQTSEDRVASNTSILTWDDKTEIVQPNDQKSEAEETAATCYDGHKSEEAVSVPNLNEFGILHEEDDTSKSVLNGNQLDGIDSEPENHLENTTPKPILHEDQVDNIDSEPDYHVDALNTTGSESDTDHDFQTKQEGQPICLPEVEDTESVEVLEPMSQRGLHHLSGTGFDGSTSITLNKEMPESAPAESPAIEENGEIADSGRVLSVSMFEMSNVDHDGPTTESGHSNQFSSGSFLPLFNENRSNLFEHHESSMKLAAVNFWTNGGLLGLQPAKPADFAPTSRPDTEADFPTKDITDLSSNHKGNNYEASRGVGENGADVKSRYGDTNGGGLSSVTLVAPGSAMPVARTPKVAHIENRNGSDENFYGVFGVSHRIFVNSFRKKISFVYDEKPDQAGVKEQDHDDQHISKYPTSEEKATEEQFEVWSPIRSLPPSPPLEHMKLSFQPVNDFGTSKLGLRFADDKNCKESSRDMFASFQLFPEPSFRLEDAGSDSDGDTFCQSSRMSGLSRDFDSDAEQWESENGVEPHLSCPMSMSGATFNLPRFDSFLSPPNQERNGDSDRKSNSFAPPPAEWRASELQTDMGEEEQQEQSQGLLILATEEKRSVSTIPHQHQQGHAMQHKVSEEIIQVIADRKSRQKFAIEEAHGGGGEKVLLDENEGFLQQIRTKSFNLRRTAPAKSTTTNPNTNVKVTAILEKANAIRQAVGSDYGEDDSWSDT